MAPPALPAELVRQVETLSRLQKLKLVEHVIHDLASDEDAAEVAGGSVIGALADQDELLDEIVESAMQARERDPLRRPGA